MDVFGTLSSSLKRKACDTGEEPLKRSRCEVNPPTHRPRVSPLKPSYPSDTLWVAIASPNGSPQKPLVQGVTPRPTRAYHYPAPAYPPSLPTTPIKPVAPLLEPFGPPPSPPRGEWKPEEASRYAHSGNAHTFFHRAQAEEQDLVRRFRIKQRELFAYGHSGIEASRLLTSRARLDMLSSSEFRLPTLSTLPELDGYTEVIAKKESEAFDALSGWEAVDVATKLQMRLDKMACIRQAAPMAFRVGGRDVWMG